MEVRLHLTYLQRWPPLPLLPDGLFVYGYNLPVGPLANYLARHAAVEQVSDEEDV